MGVLPATLRVYLITARQQSTATASQVRIETEAEPHVTDLHAQRDTAFVVEKPDKPPSDYAVTGVYFYDNTVWKVLPELKPSGRGELEITDVNNWYVERDLMEYDILEGFWGDAGESIDAYYAVNDFVRRFGANK